jgi:hypothetical protein
MDLPDADATSGVAPCRKALSSKIMRSPGFS